MKYKNIFHIDDDQDDTEFFFAAALESSRNVKVEIFFDSRKALERLTDVSILPDAIFLDLNMPNLDGFQFLRRIKSNATLECIPVIILSTSSQQVDVDAAMRLGAKGFITKPTNYYDLVDILKSFL